MSQAPIIDLSALGRNYQIVAYEGVRLRAISNPTVAVKCAFRLDRDIQIAVDAGIKAGIYNQQTFSLAC